MLAGRTAEIKYLNSCYESDGNQLLIVYGQKYIGKTAVLREFIQGKPCHYYMARACSGRENRYCFAESAEMRQGDHTEEEFSYGDIMRQIAAGSGTDRKYIMIFDGFERIIRTDGSFMKEVCEFMEEYGGSRKIFTILTSSSVRWVENDMIAAMGQAVHAVSDVFKIKPLDFRYVRDYFPFYSVRECIELYSVLGGFPGLWKYFDSGCSVKENICRNILDKRGALRYAAEWQALEELRETGVYNTILAAIASGSKKLNEIHRHTGFTRAKISVYLKTLIEMELVERVVSIGSDRDKDVQKGMYRISNHFMNFYYRYLFRQESSLFDISSEEYYDRNIQPYMENCIEEYFREICMQHFGRCGEKGELPLTVDQVGSWYGKRGMIDIVAKDVQGNTVLAVCSGNLKGMDYEDCRRLLVTADKAGMNKDYVWLYAAAFDKRIIWEAEKKENLVLIGLDQL